MQRKVFVQEYGRCRTSVQSSSAEHEEGCDLIIIGSEDRPCFRDLTAAGLDDAGSRSRLQITSEAAMKPLRIAGGDPDPLVVKDGP